jgi:hypothetical protein
VKSSRRLLRVGASVFEGGDTNAGRADYSTKFSERSDEWKVNSCRFKS